MNFFENNGAAFSECRNYRYALWRIWDKEKPLVMFIGLNPSTADETKPDNTIKRVKKIAHNNGFGGFYMMNCFPLVSKKPAHLKVFFETPDHDAEDLKNMRWLLDVSKICAVIVFAWGNFKEAKERGKTLSEFFKNAKALHILKDGSPKHQLFCKGQTALINYK